MGICKRADERCAVCGEAYGDALRVVLELVKHGYDQLTESGLEIRVKVHVGLVKEQMR